MVSPATAAPASQQPDASRSRSCGAVCLSTVYASLGVQADPAEIWENIAKKNNLGSVASTTHLMGKDALDRGLCAVVMQARDPMYVLRACQNAKIHAILNHRLAPGSQQGHFTILTGIDAQTVTLNDPFYKRSQTLTHSDFVQLWQPRLGESEISGFVLIAISDKPITAPECELCHMPFAKAMPCPRCGQPIALSITSVLGCLNAECAVRLWTALCCPQCDYLCEAKPSARAVTAGVSEAVAAAPGLSFAVQPVKLPPAPAHDSWNLTVAFAALDAFTAKLLSNPSAAKHPDVQQLMPILQQQKQKLTELQVRYVAEHKAQAARAASLQAASQARMQAYLQRMAEINNPAETLNADELGHALLRNLGLSR